MKPRKGYIWILTEKGLQNDFVKELFERYTMKYIVPAKWVLAGYVEEIEEVEDGNQDG